MINIPGTPAAPPYGCMPGCRVSVPMDKDLAFAKKTKLTNRLKAMDGLVVAYSGGVDSTFLLAAAQEALGHRVWAATACSPLHPMAEQAMAAAFCKDRGIVQVRLPSDGLALPEFVANPPERCYICKRAIIGNLLDTAGELGIEHVAHGANVDDAHDYRPGFKAAEEAGILSPLVEADLTKKEIRFLAREMGLAVWNKPAMACLASRIPYGSAITAEKLKAVEAAEQALMAEGFRQVRVRHHGSVARVEVPPGEMERLMAVTVRRAVATKLRRIGFDHVALDLEGYETGKMNRALKGIGS